MTKILVIEDMRDLREDVLEILRIENYEVFGADNGVAGLELAIREAPDLIVCDITMPGMDGYEVLQHIRKNREVATTPFIFLTARTERESRRHGMVLGADDYITKPFEMDELLTSISSQLRRRQELNDAANEHLEMLRTSIMTALPHELRTPLNTVIGFSEMLMMEAIHLKADQVIDWSSKVNEAGRRLHALVENYLYYVRLQMAPFQPEVMREFETAALSSPGYIIEEQATRMADRAGRVDDLVLDISESHLQIQVRYEDMVKITNELVDNAFKFSEDGTAVKVEAGLCEDHFELTVSDEGRGLTPAQIKQIGPYVQFERNFFEQQGIGFGLSLVRDLCRLYGGNTVIEAAEPGLRVTAMFPLVQE